MGAILPGGLVVAAKTQPGFMHQGGGLQGLPRSFASHLLGGERAQFLVNQREQAIGSLGIAGLDLL